MKTVNGNINFWVKVKLNEKGLAVLKAQHTELKKVFPRISYEFTPPDVDADGYSKFQLWALMQTFVHLMRLGDDPPFDTAIKIEVQE